MAQMLREADAEPVSEVAKRRGVSEQTLYTRRKRYGDVEAPHHRRLRQMEKENAHLKRLLAERDI
ncbi:MAG: transposase [Pseudomonadota bacterium]